MTDHLNLVTEDFQRFVETVNFSVESHRGVEVKDVVEAVDRILDLARGLGVPLAADLRGVHSVVHRNRRREVEVVEDGECG